MTATDWKDFSAQSNGKEAHFENYNSFFVKVIPIKIGHMAEFVIPTALLDTRL